MDIKIVKPYFDLEQGRVVKKDEIIPVSEKRGEIIIAHGMAEKVDNNSSFFNSKSKPSKTINDFSVDLESKKGE